MPETGTKASDQKKFPLLALCLFVLGGLVAGLALGPFAASMHNDSRLLVALSQEDAGIMVPGSTLETTAFRASGQGREEVRGQAIRATEVLRVGSLVWGVVCGLLLFASWYRSKRRAKKEPWSIDPERCVACGRCMAVCPLHEIKENIHGE
jgi:NAD-dependent dihydropyrimidine dehydrogenase PreA subunit